MADLYSLLKQFNAISGMDETGQSGFCLLMALWQKSNELNWNNQFTMTNTELLYRAGFNSESTFTRNRNKLKQLGYFDYIKPSNRRQCGTYILNFDLLKLSNGGSGDGSYDGSSEGSGKEKLVNDGSSDGSGEGSSGGSSDGSGAHINKLTKPIELTKRIDELINEPVDPLHDPEIKKVFDMWQSNIGVPSAIEIDKLGSWIKDLSVGAVCYAIEIAATLDYEKRNYNYINGILKNFDKLSLKTVEAIKAHELSKQKSPAPGKNGFVKKTTFNSVEGRDWDFDEMAQLEYERMKQKLSVVEGGGA